MIGDPEAGRTYCPRFQEIAMNAPFVIEDSTPADQQAIEHLLDLVFGIDRRIKTSYRLREGSRAIDGLSLLIRDPEAGLAGAISFWPLAIGMNGTEALLLGPLAVHPQRQNIGIGRALMGEGLARAKAKGQRLVLLVGDEPYYARVGFKRLPDGQLMLPGPVDPKRFLYLELVPGALSSAHGLVLPPYRHAALSAALAIPHRGDHEQQRAQA
jgi:predicted N-acetyltransferase YhbS